MGVQEVEGALVGTSCDLDQLCKSVPDLGGWKGFQEGEIQEGVDWCVVGPESVLVISIVDCNFNGNGGIDQSNDGGWDSNEVAVSSVCCTSKSGSIVSQMIKDKPRDGTHPATSVTSPPPTTKTGS